MWISTAMAIISSFEDHVQLNVSCSSQCPQLDRMIINDDEDDDDDHHHLLSIREGSFGFWKSYNLELDYYFSCFDLFLF